MTPPKPKPKRSRDLVPPSIVAEWTIFDAEVGFGQNLDDPAFRLEPHMGSVWKVERLLRELEKRQKVSIPTWEVRGPWALPKPGKDGAFYWAIVQALASYKEGYQYGPYNDVMLRLAETAQFGLLVDGKPGPELRNADDPLADFVKLIEVLINTLIVVFKTKEFRAARDRRIERYRERELSFRRLVHSCLIQPGDLRIVRVDHCVDAPWVTSASGAPVQIPHNDLESFHKLLEVRSEFAQRLSETPWFREHCLGWIHVLCGGPIPGSYIHGAYLVRDSGRSGLPHERALEDIWVAYAGPSGKTHSCKKDANPYKKMGIGLIDIKNIEKVNALYKALHYLSHKDMHFAPRNLEGKRGHWCSHLVRPKDGDTKLCKQKKKRDRLLGARVVAVPATPHAPAIRDRIDQQVQSSLKAIRPTIWDRTADDGNPSAEEKLYQYATECIELAIYYQASLDRKVVDEDLNARANRKAIKESDKSGFVSHLSEKLSQQVARLIDAAPSPEIDEVEPLLNSEESSALSDLDAEFIHVDKSDSSLCAVSSDAPADGDAVKPRVAPLYKKKHPIVISQNRPGTSVQVSAKKSRKATGDTVCTARGPQSKKKSHGIVISPVKFTAQRIPEVKAKNREKLEPGEH